MRSPARDDRMPPRRYEAARVELRCRVNTAHARQLILEHATIYTDGWASWAEDGHEYTGYVQAGPAATHRRSAPCNQTPQGASNRRTIGMPHHTVPYMEGLLLNRSHAEPSHQAFSQTDG